MASVSVYLNFNRNAEAAFMFYKSVFDTEFVGDITRMGDAPLMEGQAPLAEDEKNLVMHVALPLLSGFMLMGSDVPQSMGVTVNPGNNVYINLEPDTRTETEALFAKLAQDGTIDMPLQDMFWGDYFGSVVDKFGIHWMFNCSEKK